MNGGRATIAGGLLLVLAAAVLWTGCAAPQPRRPPWQYLNERGDERRSLKYYHVAIVYYSQALKLVLARGDTAELFQRYYNRGSTWIAMRQYDRAIDDLSAMVARAPRRWDVWCELADARYRDGDFLGAAGDYQKCLKARATNAWRWNGRIKKLIGLCRALAGDLQGLVRDSRRYALGSELLAVYHLLRGDRQRGDQALCRAVVTGSPAEIHTFFQQHRVLRLKLGERTYREVLGRISGGCK